ncbi:MAG: isochorismatase family protein [Phycisphaerae bacterium]
MPPDRILLDIESQRDFFRPGGSLYGPGAAETARRIYRLFAWARAYRIPVISTVLRVRRGELGPLAAVPHCVEDTDGERKLPGTVLGRRINLGLLNTTDLPDHILVRYQQVIFEKRSTSIFSHARIERLITELPPVTFVLCGAGIAHGIVEAAVGLRRRGFGVILAEDAALAVDADAAEMARRRMEAKGVVFATTEGIVAPPVHVPRRRFRSPQPTERQALWVPGRK